MKQKLFEIEGSIKIPHDFNNCDCVDCNELVERTNEFLDKVDILINETYAYITSVDGNINIDTK